ncbi:MAG: BREX-1 system phosphatase PglZ type B, partial [Phycisphaerales bacterium JB058]
MTVLEALRDAIRAKDLALDGEVRPAAILWTDPNGDWKSCLDLLRDSIPELLTLGEYDTGTRTGPAIWLRCVIDGPLRDGVVPEDVVPIVYLPGVKRSQLQAGEECPEAIRPLVELMYRGTAWLQKNGSDWTARAFLGSNQSLGLELAGDQATNEAIVRALPEVLTQQVDQLRGRKLTATDFDKLLSDDHIRDLLQWIGNPDRTRARLGDTRWSAFVNQCRDALDFDPSAKQPFEAGELLGKGEGNWKAVWQRYIEGPSGYPGVVDILRRCRPNEGLFGESGERWPDLNDEQEEVVRNGLQSLSDMSHRAACDLVCELEREHGARRDWVWAKLGLSPMAAILKPLSQLASGARQAMKAATPSEYAKRYAEDWWIVD